MTVSFVLKIASIERLSSDQLLLKQLMTILFDNAIKYTEEDGEIDFMISATDRNLYLLVSDNGVGISAEDKKKNFLIVFIEWTRLEPVKKVVSV